MNDWDAFALGFAVGVVAVCGGVWWAVYWAERWHDWRRTRYLDRHLKDVR